MTLSQELIHVFYIKRLLSVLPSERYKCLTKALPSVCVGRWRAWKRFWQKQRDFPNSAPHPHVISVWKWFVFLFAVNVFPCVTSRWQPVSVCWMVCAAGEGYLKWHTIIRLLQQWFSVDFSLEPCFDVFISDYKKVTQSRWLKSL